MKEKWKLIRLSWSIFDRINCWTLFWLLVSEESSSRSKSYVKLFTTNNRQLQRLCLPSLMGKLSLLQLWITGSIWYTVLKRVIVKDSVPLGHPSSYTCLHPSSVTPTWRFFIKGFNFCTVYCQVPLWRTPYQGVLIKIFLLILS